MSHDLPLAASGQSAPAPPAPRPLDLVAQQLAATEEVFRQHLASDVPFIDQAGRYLAQGGGKRIRPALLLLSAKLLGHDGREEVTYAAVVELIHTATLIHDDIIDHAALRRGRASLHKLWDNHRTVLLGDWIYTTSMQMALAHGRVEVIRRLCAATLRMTEGELLVLERLGAPDVSVDQYFDIIHRKTAALFAAACSIPSLIPPLRPEAGQVLERYGRELGLCFQLVDDLLDFTAREDELGKPVLSDLKEGKLTLPLVLLLPRLAAGERRRIEMVLEDRAFDRVAAEEILGMVRAAGTLEEVEEVARRHGEAARRELAYFPPSPARDALDHAPDFVLSRRF
jgi:octaprenyl-diphosphate synthase